MLQSELEYAKGWRLRKWLTDLRKAREGNRLHPTGLSRLMADHIDNDICRVAGEIESRKKAART